MIRALTFLALTLWPLTVLADSAPPGKYHLHDGPQGAWCEAREWFEGGVPIHGRGRLAVTIRFMNDIEHQGQGVDRWWWNGERAVPDRVALTYPVVRPFSTSGLKWADVTPPVPATVLLEHPEIESIMVTCIERGRERHETGHLLIVTGRPENEQELRAALGQGADISAFAPEPVTSVLHGEHP